MKDTSPRTIHLKEYREPDYLIDQFDLEFDLGNTAENTNTNTKTKVKSKLAIRTKNQQSGAPVPLVLDGIDLKLKSIQINGKELSASEYVLGDESLTISKVPNKFELSIEVEIDPAANACLEGLYKSGSMFTTQCEAEGFRRITYCIDRPDVMSSYRTKIIGPKNELPVLLSNGNLVEAGELDGGRHFAIWDDPHKKPTYLFAIVAGDLVYISDKFKTMSGRNIELRLYAEKENIDRCHHGMESLIKSMKWDEEVFGREYDLDIFNIVAVNDFNAGAMENKGLNIFNAKYILANPESATDDDYIKIEGVIGHEYFHNWSGNRVTCRDWFQLSLKEGFTVFRDQEFSADMNSRAVERITDVRNLVDQQFPEDAGPTSHSVRPESYIEVDNFYTRTVYEKGAEVVRMMATILGRENFRKGTDLYFERHDGCAVTCDDFVQAMEDASGIDLKQFRLWYSQAGTPVVVAKGSYDAPSKSFRLVLSQSCPDTPGQTDKKPFHIPVKMGLLGENGQSIPLYFDDKVKGANETVLNLTEASQTFTFTNVTSKPIPSLLRGFSSPVNLEEDSSNDDRAFVSANDTDEYCRWNAGQTLAHRTLLDMIPKVAEGKTPDVSESLQDVFAKTLTNLSLDHAFVALALKLPSATALVESLDVADPDVIHRTRVLALKGLAKKHRDLLRETYERLIDQGPFEKDPTAMGRRALKNTCLAYLMKLQDQEIDMLCYKQFKTGTNMTDVMIAFQLLCHRDADLRKQAIKEFYDKWKNDKLVLNKWFAAQALSCLDGTLERVRELTEDPKFNLKNPNNVFFLIHAFCSANFVQFHKTDGSGYKFAGELVTTIDKFNNKVASTIVSCFNRRVKFDLSRQVLMKAELQKIKSTAGLSKGVFEIVSKNLAN